MRSLIFSLLCLFPLVGFSDDPPNLPPGSTQWADPLPEDPSWTAEQIANNWTNHLQGEVDGWSTTYSEYGSQNWYLTSQLSELSDLTTDSVLVACLDAAAADLLKASIHADFANGFNSQATPLIESAQEYLPPEAWQTSINYCSQAYPKINEREGSSIRAGEYIYSAAMNLVYVDESISGN